MPLTVTSLDHRTGNVAPVIDAGHYRVSTQPRPQADIGRCGISSPFVPAVKVFLSLAVQVRCAELQ